VLGLLLTAACQGASSHPDQGTGGTPGGSGGSLGNGTGGHATGGNPGGGAGGRTGAGGSSTAAGGSPGTGSGGMSGAGCAALPLCDTFETTPVGGPPSATLWTLIPTSAASGATIDAIGAHGSSRSVKINNANRLYLRNSSVISGLGGVVHVRFNVRFMIALPQGHGALVATHPVVVNEFDSHPEFRFGSQDTVFHWNTETDQANIPDTSPQGDATSFTPQPNTWYCIELTINRGNGHLNVSVDGVDIHGLTEDGVPTPNVDQAWLSSADSVGRYAAITDVNFGWESFGSGPMTVWFDDIALSGTLIGCQD